MINRKKIWNHDGYTMVEVIVSMAIAVLIIGAIIQLIYFTMYSYTFQDIKSRQYLVMEQLEWLVSREMRYSDEIYITDEDFTVYGDDYAMIEADSTGVKITDIDGERRLVIDEMLKEFDMKMVFTADEETDVDLHNENNLFVMVYLDEGHDWELTQGFNFKMINISLDDTKEVEEITGASGNRVVYRLSDVRE